MDLVGVIPPQLIEIAMDVLLPLIEGCLKQKSPADVMGAIRDKDPIALYYLRKSIRSKMSWEGQGKDLYDTLVNSKPSDAQVEGFVNHFNANKLDYLDLV